mmetsp:Transcript_16053/g.31442  ORF Transcript_16053/g.31442 Transcript_16053/m.31442 type:complete len:301 (+) Transcript_16053:36-938(+)
MFKFNFSVDTGDAETVADGELEQKFDESTVQPAIVEISKQDFNGLTGTADSKVEELIIDKCTFRKRIFLGEQTGLGDLVKTSDLVSGVYEGGFKLWECAVDMVTYLQELKGENELSCVHGKRVADIGCGHGLPGVWCAQEGAAYVAFQDLNHEVLSNCTLPNLVLNTSLSLDAITSTLSVSSSRAGFFAGDWKLASTLSSLMLSAGAAGSEEGRYDFIVTCDTLYSSASLPFLRQMFDLLLTSKGVAYVAAKRFYFGVGGSVSEFLHLCQNSSPRFVGEVVRSFEDGKSNIRDIIKIVRE